MNKLTIFTALAVMVLVSGCTTEGIDANCCPKCSDPNAILVKAPGGVCACYTKCPSGDPNLLVTYTGDTCCTDEDCSVDEAPPTTIPCRTDGYESCSGSCDSGKVCTYDYRYDACYCMNDCNDLYTNGDVKVCYEGGCPTGQYCDVSLDGRKCACQQSFN